MVAYFLVGCGEFERDQQVLLDDVCRIVGRREWLDEFLRIDRGKGGFTVGKGGGWSV